MEKSEVANLKSRTDNTIIKKTLLLIVKKVGISFNFNSKIN